MEGMSRRGEKLRDHVLWTAKATFLELGFERASMDEVAARAETSKRTLYAHFESKENLFLAVVELARELFLDRMREPSDYGDDPKEALVLFLGRYLEAMVSDSFVRMSRVAIAEAERFPQGASRYFEVIFDELRTRLAAYLGKAFGLGPADREAAAERLLGEILHPRWPRVLLGVEPTPPRYDGEGVSEGFDLSPVRRAVEAFAASL